MGAAASAREFNTEAEALAAGRTQEDIDQWKAQNAAHGVQVTVHTISKVRDADTFFGKSDPFVVLRVGSAGQTFYEKKPPMESNNLSTQIQNPEVRTSVVKDKDTNISFEETLWVPFLDGKFPDKAELHVAVFDDDTGVMTSIGGDDSLSECKISLVEKAEAPKQDYTLTAGITKKPEGEDDVIHNHEGKITLTWKLCTADPATGSDKAVEKPAQEAEAPAAAAEQAEAPAPNEETKEKAAE
jgi:hypothetical protein